MRKEIMSRTATKSQKSQPHGPLADSAALRQLAGQFSQARRRDHERYPTDDALNAKIPWGRAPGAIAIHRRHEEPCEQHSCCVALHVLVTRDRPDGDVDILKDTVHVEVGTPERALRNLIYRRFDGRARRRLLSQIRALGTIAATLPLTVDGLHEGKAGICVCVEVLVLPITRAEGKELRAIRSRSAAGQRAAWTWAEDLERRWRATAAPVPHRFLADAPGRCTPRGESGSLA
jgi:hypothetical protein